jgi:histidine triad (HIT) family protein
MEQASIFTKIINREIPAEIIFENDNLIVINNIHPQAPIHWLIIPKIPIPTLHDLLQDVKNKDLLWELLSTAGTMAEKAGIDKSGYRVSINVGEDGGQTIFHLHIHLLGGKKLEE